MSDFPTFRAYEPKTVEAYQWLPEDPEHTAKVMAWLLHYPRTKFVVEPVDDSALPRGKMIGFPVNGAGFDAYAWPGDWIVRRGPAAYTVYEDNHFRASFGEDFEVDEDG